MVFILLFAVGLGLSLNGSTAGLGVPLLLFGPATVLRATPIILDRRREGRIGDAKVKIEVYFQSCLIVGLFLLAASIAFAAVCFPIGLSYRLLGDTPLFWIALAVGGLAWCLAIFLIGRRIFPPKD